MKKLAVILLILSSLAACDERYRYHCQDPANWGQKRCQRPDCQFTQDCPDYLVAPVLERQAQQPAHVASEPK